MEVNSAVTDQFTFFNRLRASLRRVAQTTPARSRVGVSRLVDAFEYAPIVDCSAALTMAGDVLPVCDVRKLMHADLTPIFDVIEEHEYQNQRLPWDSCIFHFSGHPAIPEIWTYAYVIPENPTETVFLSVFETTQMQRQYLQGFDPQDLNMTAEEFAQIKMIELMHCRNVGVCAAAAREEPRSVRRQRERVMGQRRYQVLDLSRITAKGTGGVSGNTLSRALHVCRGHFRTYTAEAPLFGRITGRVFVPSHVRGNPEAGLVESDYSLGSADAEQ